MQWFHHLFTDKDNKNSIQYISVINLCSIILGDDISTKYIGKFCTVGTLRKHLDQHYWPWLLCSKQPLLKNFFLFNAIVCYIYDHPQKHSLTALLQRTIMPCWLYKILPLTTQKPRSRPRPNHAFQVRRNGYRTNFNKISEERVLFDR